VTRRARHLLCGGIAAVIAASALLSSARGQADEGPIIINAPKQQRQLEKFHMDPWILSLNLTGVYQHNDVKNQGVRAETHQQVFEETIEGSTTAYIVHPNFFTLSIDAEVGAQQNFVQSAGDAEDVYSGLYNWDIHGTLLRNGNAPLTLFSTREQSWTFPTFGPAIRNTTSDTGASLDIRSRELPTQLRISHLTSEQTGFSSDNDLSYTRDGFDWFSSYRPAPNQVLKWNYSYAHVEQKGFTDDTYDKQDARLSHQWDFGRKLDSTLTSSVEYNSQSGRSDLQHFRWDERLRLQHTRDFRTHYDYTFDYYSIQQTETKRNRLGAGFTHQLYRSLTTNGDVAIQHTDTEGSGTVDVTANLDVDYQKKVPYGTLTASAGVFYGWQRADASNGTTVIIDQPVTFTDPQPIVLTGTNVNPNSIVITDPSGLLIYRPGIDYTVRQFNNRVEISREPGGQIASNQAALIDYQLLPLPASTSDTFTYFGYLRYDIQRGWLSGLGVYGRYTASNQNISSSNSAAFVPNDYTDIIYGADYRIWRLTFGAEREIHDAEINPFIADRFYARYSQRLELSTSLNLSTAYTTIDYSDPANRTNLFTASAQVVHQFSDKLNASLTLLYRYEDDDLFGRLDGFEEQFEIRWQHRQLSVYALVRNAQLNTEFEQQSYQFFEIGLRRQF
jgi:hypothetical protein